MKPVFLIHKTFNDFTNEIRTVDNSPVKNIVKYNVYKWISWIDSNEGMIYTIVTVVGILIIVPVMFQMNLIK
jgi:hypothetical protein